MIKLSKIDDKLSVYKENKVVLFGAANTGLEVKNTLERLGVCIALFCDNDSGKWGNYINGVYVISPLQLQEMYNSKIIIQIASIYGSDIEKQLQKMGIENYISYQEYRQRIYDLSKYCVLTKQEHKLFYQEKAHLFDVLKTNNEWPMWDYALRVRFYNLDSYTILCMPPKTGDWTLNASIQKYHGDFVNFWHTYRHMQNPVYELLKDKRIKIVSAVREPVSQNISIFFNMCDSFWDISEYWQDGGNVQLLFDSWISQELGDETQWSRTENQGCKRVQFPYFDSFKKAEGIDYVIQHFFENQFEPYNHIDVYQYPFDQRKGYSIIQLENMEVFIYQIEKLNNLVDVLGEFLGIEDFTLSNDNIGNDKWYACAYRESLMKLKLSKDYLNNCYNSKFMKHFYSTEDIERFRQRWLRHIEE